MFQSRFCAKVLVFFSLVFFCSLSRVWAQAVVFSDDFESGVLDPLLWDQQVDTGNSLSIESGRLKAVFWSVGATGVKSCYAIAKPISLPEDWTCITVSGTWGYGGGSTGEGLMRVFAAGRESTMYMNCSCAAWDGPLLKYSDSCGLNVSTGSYSFPPVMTPFSWTITRQEWSYVENTIAYVDQQPCDTMAEAMGLQFKLGGWDVSYSQENIYYFDDIVVTVRRPGETGADPIVIDALPFEQSGSSCDYADDYAGCCGVGDSGGDVVFSYEPSEGGFVNVSLSRSSYDTRLYVYDGNPEESGECIACSDDDVRVNKSALYHLAVQSGHTYYIVVDGDNGGCGPYYLLVEDGSIEPESCPGDSDFSQIPPGKFDMWNGGFSDGYTDYTDYEYFTVPTGERIITVTWWGLNLSYDSGNYEPCDKGGDYFKIRLYSGTPDSVGPLLKEWIGLDPTRVDTGLTYYSSSTEQTYPLYRYTVTLTEPVSLDSGWISIWGYNLTGDCIFVWMSSPEGDGTSIVYNGSWRESQDFDLSLCLDSIECFPISAPYDPYPPDGSTNVERDVTLTWACDDSGMPVFYDVYLAELSSGHQAERLGLTEPRIRMAELWQDYGGALTAGDTYMWSVFSRNACFSDESVSYMIFQVSDRWACDLDEDNNIDVWDLLVLGDNWLTDGCSTHDQWCQRLDITRDGEINIDDFADLASHWLYNVGVLSNDECAGSLELQADVFYGGSTNGATGTDMTYCGTDDTRDVWYQFTPETSGEYVFHFVCGSDLDGTLGLFESCEGECVMCSVGFTYNTVYYPPQIQTNLGGGTTYFIRVAGKNNVEGDFQIRVQNVLSLSEAGLVELGNYHHAFENYAESLP